MPAAKKNESAFFFAAQRQPGPDARVSTPGLSRGVTRHRKSNGKAPGHTRTCPNPCRHSLIG